MKIVFRLLILGSLCGLYAYAAQQPTVGQKGITPMCIVTNGSNFCCGTVCSWSGCSGPCQE